MAAKMKAPGRCITPLAVSIRYRGGILKTIPLEQRKKYNAVAVDGLNRCIQTLRDIRDNKITGYVLEMSSCVDSCVGGPGLHEHGTPFLLSKSAV